MTEDNSYHHLYYSAHADPVHELEKLNKSCLKLNSKTQNGSHAFAENSVEDEDYQPQQQSLTNGNIQISSSRQLLTTSSNNNMMTTPVRSKKENMMMTNSGGHVQMTSPGGGKGNTCCSCCCLISVLVCISLGFIAGVFSGILAHRNGFGNHLDRIFPIKHGTEMISDNDEAGEATTNANSYKCTVRLNNQVQKDIDLLQNCDTCFKARLLNVSNADYADCNGVYTLSNLSSVWDTKRVVYQRIHGGIKPQDKRYIYWNSHFYGPNFYGWSIGDSRSLFESGPFHAQGREGVSDQPWLGSWNDNVTVSMVSCGGSQYKQGKFRFNKQKLEELLQGQQQQIKEDELEENKV